MVRTRSRLVSSQVASGFKRHSAAKWYHTSTCLSRAKYTTFSRTTRFGYLTRQRTPRAVVHVMNHGLRRGEGDEAESLGGFCRVCLEGHGRTRTTAGARGSQHRRYWGTQEPQPRSCSFQGSSRNRVPCTWYPRASYKG